MASQFGGFGGGGFGGATLTGTQTPKIEDLITKSLGASTTTQRVQPSLESFLEGDVGDSPLTRAAIEQFKLAQLPIIEGQIALQGLSRSPALSIATAQGLGTALPQFINKDLDNRFRAVEGLQAQQALEQRPLDFSLQARLGLEEAERARLGLGFQERQLALEEAIRPAQLALQQEIQRGQLGLAGRQVSLEELIRPGELGLQERQVALSETIEPRKLDIQERLGFGQLAVQERAITLDEKIRDAQLRLEEEIRRGELRVTERGIELRERTEDEKLQQSSAALAAQISGASLDRQIRAASAAAEVALGYGAEISLPLAALETERQLSQIQLMLAAGTRIEEIEQAIFDADFEDSLRLQELSERVTTEILGGGGLSALLGLAER